MKVSLRLFLVGLCLLYFLGLTPKTALSQSIRDANPKSFFESKNNKSFSNSLFWHPANPRFCEVKPHSSVCKQNRDWRSRWRLFRKYCKGSMLEDPRCAKYKEQLLTRISDYNHYCKRFPELAICDDPPPDVRYCRKNPDSSRCKEEKPSWGCNTSRDCRPGLACYPISCHCANSDAECKCPRGVCGTPQIFVYPYCKSDDDCKKNQRCEYHPPDLTGYSASPAVPCTEDGRTCKSFHIGHWQCTNKTKVLAIPFYPQNDKQ